MSKEELQSIIYDVRTSAQEKGNIFSLMSCALYTMSVEAFGKLGATHLWWYIFESDENRTYFITTILMVLTANSFI